MSIVDWSQICGAFIAILTFVGWVFISWSSIVQVSKNRFKIIVFFAVLSGIASVIADFLQVALIPFRNTEWFPVIVIPYGILVIVSHVAVLILMPLVFAGLQDKDESSCVTILMWGIYILTLMIFGFHTIEALLGKPFGFQLVF